ncbi:hypothetical protein H5T58_02525 [Candidatus Parcubacteria bacterium]|nr:hypothetical protein [Candidatus Parcubacteria bacterium]
MPSSLLNFYKGFLKRKKEMGFAEKEVKLKPCEKCGSLTVTQLCNFCRLKEKIQSFQKNISHE